MVIYKRERYMFLICQTIDKTSEIYNDSQQIYYTMQKDQSYQDQKYLLSSLLKDDDIPTSTSLKNEKNCDKEFAFSAPPILFNLTYRIEEDFFEEFQKPYQQNSLFLTPQKPSQKQKQKSISEFDLPPLNSMRKMSLQNEDYSSYQAISIPQISYMQSYTPEEEVLNHIGNVSQWARDQYGSRTVQNALETGGDYLKQKIFEHIYLQCLDLMHDKFGNYVVQKIFEVGLQSHKDILFMEVKRNFVSLSMHVFGCRIVQKAVQYASQCESDDKQTELIKIIDQNAMSIILNQNGNHVIQKCFEVSREIHLQNILHLIIQNLNKLSFHAYGCRVVQKYLQCGRNEILIEEMLTKLIGMGFYLSQCQYGNYIMQFIVAHCRKYEKQIEQIFSNHFVELSSNKFASNVMQKVIKASSSEFKEKITLMLIQSGEFITLSKHQYGNYVIQSLLDKVNREYKLQLRTKLKENCQQISRTQYGRHVLMQLDRSK